MGALQQHPALSRDLNAGLLNVSPNAGVPGGPARSEYETLSGLLRVLRRRRRTVASVALGLLVLGTLVCFLITPKYASMVVIEIDHEDHAQNVSADSAAATPTADELKTEIATSISVLQSDGLALQVIHDLNLMQVSPFTKDIDPKEKDKPLDQAPLTRDKLIARFEKNLTVESPPDTRLIDVTFLNPDPTVAANVANALSQRFIEGAMDRRHKSTVQSSYWLRRELADLKKQVEDSEQKLADYQRKTGLAGMQVTGADGGGGAITSHNTVTDRLFSLNQELTAAESNRISAATVYDLVRTQDPEVVLGLGSMSVFTGSGGGSGALTADGGIQLVRSLRAEEAELSQQYASASVKYGANNPRLVQTQQQLDAVRLQMHAELARISKRAENAYLYAKQNEDTIRKQFVAQQSAANAMADNSVHLQVLAQEAYSNRTLYESLFSKLQTASLASGVRATRVDVVEEGRPAGKPSSPKYLKFLAILAGLSLFFGISAAYVQESLDETVRRPLDLLGIPDLTFLGYVPRMEMKGLLTTAGGDSKLSDLRKSPFSEAFRNLRTSILRRLPSGSSKILLVTSAVGGEGKTTVAYNLGVAFAWQGARVLLIDCDLRNPDLHRLFGCAISPGVSDVSIPVTDAAVIGVIKHTDLPNLHILPAGQREEFPAELFESKTFDAMLEICSRHYDYVVLDSPPMLSSADSSVLASKVNGTVAVVRSRSTTSAALGSLVETLNDIGSPLVGVLLNDVQNPVADGFHPYMYSRPVGRQAHD